MSLKLSSTSSRDGILLKAGQPEALCSPAGSPVSPMSSNEAGDREMSEFRE